MSNDINWPKEWVECLSYFVSERCLAKERVLGLKLQDISIQALNELNKIGALKTIPKPIEVWLCPKHNCLYSEIYGLCNFWAKQLILPGKPECPPPILMREVCK